jgi:hypothetical protein
MSRLGASILEALVLEHGREEVVRRLADPFWFQALGAVLGMDWHSSGITTSVMGALKAGLAENGPALGIWICGGRGRHSRKTPEELLRVGDRTGLDGEKLAGASRLTAKVDNCAVQDGFQIYQHSFVVTAAGEWAVVQQGMNPSLGLARRYHWLSSHVRSFVEEPHEAIVGEPGRGAVLNLTDRQASAARDLCQELAVERPEEVVSLLRRLRDRGPQLSFDEPAPPLDLPALEAAPRLTLPSHHAVRAADVDLRRLQAVLRTAAERDTNDFSDLLLVPGLGPRTVQALALTAEVVYGAPSRFRDPARFAFAHGGKDGHPHPVPLRVYDETLRTLRDALARTKLGRTDKLEAFRRLDARVRAAEQSPPGLAEEMGSGGPDLAAITANEWRRSPEWGGRTAAGPRLTRAASHGPARPAARGQGDLFGASGSIGSAGAAAPPGESTPPRGARPGSTEGPP